MELNSAKVARLDHDLVYWGLEERAIADIKPGDLVFGAPELVELLPEGAVYVSLDCDLAGGQQRWDGAARQFVPLPRFLRKSEAGTVSVERAMYEYFWAQYSKDPAALPAATLDWAHAYEKTNDALISLIDGAPLFLNNFHAATGRKRK